MFAAHALRFVRINRLHLWDWVKQELTWVNQGLFRQPSATPCESYVYASFTDIGSISSELKLYIACMSPGVPAQLHYGSIRSWPHRATEVTSLQQHLEMPTIKAEGWHLKASSP